MTALNIAIGVALLCALGWLFTAIAYWAAEERAAELAAKLERLTDRDARGRFVRKEPK